MEITGLNQNYNIRPTKSMRQASTPIDGPREISFGLKKMFYLIGDKQPPNSLAESPVKNFLKKLPKMITSEESKNN